MGLRRFLPFASGSSTEVSRPFTPSFAERRKRAERLAEDHPEAGPALSFYRKLLEIQEPLAEHRSLRRWRDRASAPSDGEGPALQLARLPVDRLTGDFREFLEELIPAATPVLAPIGRKLAGGEPGLSARTLEAFLAGRGLEAAAEGLDCTPFQLGFFPRAFLQPLAEGLAELAAGEGFAPRGASENGAQVPARRDCPVCGRLPVAALLADEPEVEGRLRLVCSLCATAWPFPRLTCPGCGETEGERLSHHVADDWPHVRVEDCESCRRYLKTVDLREDGNAVPVVDDIASPELDVWADDEELRKIQPNILGI